MSLWTSLDGFCLLDADENVNNERSFSVSVSMEYDLRGNDKDEIDELVFERDEFVCLMCFIEISGTERLKCVAPNRSHSEHTSGGVSRIFIDRFVRSERCNGGDKLPVRSKRRYSLFHKRRSNCCRIEPFVGNMRFKFESEPVEPALVNPFAIEVEADDPNEYNGDEVRVRSRDSNDGGICSLAGGDGADEAFISENKCFCVAKWCLYKVKLNKSN